jgi:hypothetical protein
LVLATKLMTSFGLKSLTTKGPVPMGPKLADVQPGAAAPTHFSNCFFWMTGDCAPTNAE